MAARKLCWILVGCSLAMPALARDPQASQRAPSPSRDPGAVESANATIEPDPMPLMLRDDRAVAATRVGRTTLEPRRARLQNDAPPAGLKLVSLPLQGASEKGEDWRLKSYGAGYTARDPLAEDDPYRGLLRPPGRRRSALEGALTFRLDGDADSPSFEMDGGIVGALWSVARR